MNILYIHGFASCGTGSKVQTLREHFGSDRVYSPDLPVEPDTAIRHLQQVLEDHPVRLLIGSSLGGYYADYLNRFHNIPSVLINPSTQPFVGLADYTGLNTNWCSGEEFEWKENYLQQLESMYRDAPQVNERYLVLLQTGDEILDYRLAAQRYRLHDVMIEQGGNHRFENLVDYLPAIEAFMHAVRQNS